MTPGRSFPIEATSRAWSEQPGDHEDTEGTPFVGPAARVLDEALEAAGIDRDRAYLTNGVKHVRFELRGRRRLHKTPARRQVTACEPWLAAELAAVAPDVVVLMPGLDQLDPAAVDHVVIRRRRDRDRPAEMVCDPHAHVVR